MNVIRCVFVPVGETPKRVSIDNSLKAFQKYVGGYIEVIPVGNGLSLICDEEAKLKQRPGNRRVGNDIIAGDFFIVGDGGEDFRSLTEIEIDTVLQRFWQVEEYTAEEVERAIYIEYIPFEE